MEGGKDHPLISRYPGSVVQRYFQQEFEEYEFPLGKIIEDKKIEKSQRLEGKLTRIFYEGPAGRSSLYPTARAIWP